MATDPWRQWAAFAALFNPAAGGLAPGVFPGSRAGSLPFIDVERFAAAARAFHQSGADSQAALAFGDFLREQWSGLMDTIWGGSAPARSTPLSQEGPALGPTREHQERWQRAAAAGRRLQEAQGRLQRLWSDALGEAARTFASRLTSTTAPLTPEALHALYDDWVDCAEEAYARMAQGETFTTALAAAVNASSEWRDQSAASIEPWAKWLDWPTRSEINSLLMRVRALEEQQREPSLRPKIVPSRKSNTAASRKPKTAPSRKLKTAASRESQTAARRKGKKSAATGKKRPAGGTGKR